MQKCYPKSANTLRVGEGLKRDWIIYKRPFAANLYRVWAPGWLWALICDSAWRERRYERTDWWGVKGGSQNSLVTKATEEQRGWSCTPPAACVCVIVRVCVCVRALDCLREERCCSWWGSVAGPVRVFRVRAGHAHTACAQPRSQNVSRRRRNFILNFSTCFWWICSGLCLILCWKRRGLCDTAIMVFIGTSLKSVIKYFKRKGKLS